MRNIRIGICDDTEAIHDQLRKYIKTNFAEEISFADFMDGRELVEYQGEIDALFLDIDMPRLDGIEAGRILHKRGFSGKIILLTSVKERATEGYEIGVYRYLPKPIEEKKLVKIIQEVQECFAGMELVEISAEGEKYQIHQRNISYIARLPHSSQTEVIVGNFTVKEVSVNGWRF